MFRTLTLLSLFVTLACASALGQQTVTWTGNADGIFFDNPPNWSSSPTGSDNVLGIVDTLNLSDDFIISNGDTVEHFNHLGASTNEWSLNVSSNSTLVLTDTTAFFGIRAADLVIDTGGTVQGQFLANNVSTSVGTGGTLILHGTGNPINASTVDFTGDLTGRIVSFETQSNFISEHIAKLSVNGEIASITAGNISITTESTMDFTGDGIADTVTIAQGVESAPFLFADLDGDGVINADDWNMLRSNLFGNPVVAADPENPTTAEFQMTYTAGDLDSDFDVDLADFDLFADAYDSANGAGAFASVVPEPAGFGLIASFFAIFLMGSRRRFRASRQMKRVVQAALVVGCVAICSPSAEADIFYTGNGADPNDIYDDANYDFSSSPLADPGGDVVVEVIGGDLTSGTIPPLMDNITIANANLEVVVSRSFGSLPIGPGFTTTLDNVTLTTNTMTGGFSNGGFTGHNGVDAGGSGDPHPCFATTSMQVINGSNLDIQFIMGVTMTVDGTSSVSFRGAGNPLNANAVLGGVGMILEQGAEVSFPSSANYSSEGGAGEGPFIWAANSTGELVRFSDDPSILSFDASGATATAVFENTRGPRCPIGLEVHETTGAISLVNPNTSDAFAVELDAYSIASAGGSLDPAGWNSLQDQDRAGFPAGSGIGNGWEEGGQSDEFELGEAFLTGRSSLGAGASVNLGNAYDTNVAAGDLQFTFRDADGNLTTGAVEYVNTTGGGIACDADGDGDCGLDDLNAFYAAAGSAGAADFSGNGTIGPEDIQGWLEQASTDANAANADGRTIVIGDLDLDYDVDSTDLGLLLNNFNDDGGSPGAGPGWGGGDVTMDGVVNSTDLGQLLNNFNFNGAAAQSVPEPSPACFAIGLALGLLGLRRKNR